MGKIGDLWVKLGLKKDGFDKGIKEAKTQTSSFVSSIKGIGVKAAAIWTAVGAGALAAAKKFAQHSQRFGDAWDQAMSRMKSAWGQFLTSLTNWDWDGFWNRVKGGADAAAKSTAAHDAEFEVQNSIRLRKSMMQEELAALQIEMRNTQLSYEQRAAAAKKYLDKIKPLYKQEQDLRRNIYLSDTNEYLAAAGLKQDAAHRQALVDFFLNIAPDENIMNALVEYGKHAQGRSGKYTKKTKDIIDKLVEQYGTKSMSSFSVLAEHYLGSSNEEAKKVVDAIEAYYASKAAFDEETRRVQTVMNTAEAQAGIDTSTIDTSGGNFDNGGPSQVDKIARRAEDAAKTEVELLTEKYEEEKALLEKHGRDTTALTNEYLNNILNLNGDYLQEIADQCEAFEPVEIEPIEVNDDEFEKFVENLRKTQEEAQRLADEFNNAVVEGFSQGVKEMTDQLFGLTEFNPGRIFQALLEPLADMAIREGELLMLQGAGVEAIKTSLTTLNGFAAITAGAALVAIGAAAKSGLAAIANSSSTGTTASTYQPSNSGVQTQQIENELTVYVEGRISGDSIVLSGQRTTNKWNR